MMNLRIAVALGAPLAVAGRAGGSSSGLQAAIISKIEVWRTWRPASQVSRADSRATLCAVARKSLPQAKARDAFIARAVDPLTAIQWALYDRTGSGALKSGRRKELGYCAEPSRFRAFMAKALFGSIVNAVL